LGIIYEVSPSKFEGSFNPYRYNGVQQYEKHFGNLLYLEFIAMNPRSTFSEKRQAETEMEIAKRKLRYWKRIVDNQGQSEEMSRSIQRIKKEWKRK